LVDDIVGDVHRWDLLERTDHGEADQVGEGDLAAAGALEVVVDDNAVVDHHLGWNRTHGGGGRHGEGGIHVGGDGLHWATQRGALFLTEKFGGRGSLRCLGRDRRSLRCWFSLLCLGGRSCLGRRGWFGGTSLGRGAWCALAVGCWSSSRGCCRWRRLRCRCCWCRL